MYKYLDITVMDKNGTEYFVLTPSERATEANVIVACSDSPDAIGDDLNNVGIPYCIDTLVRR